MEQMFIMILDGPDDPRREKNEQAIMIGKKMRESLKNQKDIILVESIDEVPTGHIFYKVMEQVMFYEPDKPFILNAPKNEELKPLFPDFSSPIDAITTHKKKGKYRP